MRATNDGKCKGSPTAGPVQFGGSLSLDELALPAVCGPTRKPFLMVVRRQGRGALELIRAVAMPPVKDVPVHRATSTDTPWKFCPKCGQKLESTRKFCSGCGKELLPQTQSDVPSPAALSSGADGEKSADSFQALTLNAQIVIGSHYAGCPYCRSRWYFHCHNCELSSCGGNTKPHLDHTDVWCAACQLWSCTSKADSFKLTAYAASEKAVDL